MTHTYTKKCVHTIERGRERGGRERRKIGMNSKRCTGNGEANSLRNNAVSNFFFFVNDHDFSLAECNSTHTLMLNWLTVDFIPFIFNVHFQFCIASFRRTHRTTIAKRDDFSQFRNVSGATVGARLFS